MHVTIALNAANDPQLPDEEPINDPGNEDPGSVIDPDLPPRSPVPPKEPDRPQRPVEEPQAPKPTRH